MEEPLPAPADEPAEQPPSPPPAALLACPHCLKAVVLPADHQGPVIDCPHCGQEFSVPAFAAPPPHGPTPEEVAADPFAYIVDDAEPEAAQAKREELDGLRIRQIAHLRRSAYRHRSYCLVGAIACAAVVGQLIYLILRTVRQFGFLDHGRNVRMGIYAAAIVLLGRWALALWRRAAHYEAESLRSDLGEPATPPSFDALNDGSQHWKNLDRLK